MTTTTTPKPTGLAALLTEYRARTGASYADIAARTGMSRASVGAIINSAGPRAVRHDTLGAIATGLGIPYAAVRDAAAVSAGHADADAGDALPDDVALLAEQARALTPDQLEAVAALVATFRAQGGIVEPR